MTRRPATVVKDGDDGAVELLSRILADRPNLPGAACIGKHDLVDASRAGVPEAMSAHRLMCRHCPERHRCPDALTEETP